MILIENKRDRFYGKITRISWKEYNILYSRVCIMKNQNLDKKWLISSNYLIRNIYNDINRE
jgi:hypothetical protein